MSALLIGRKKEYDRDVVTVNIIQRKEVTAHCLIASAQQIFLYVAVDVKIH